MRYLTGMIGIIELAILLLPVFGLALGIILWTTGGKGSGAGEMACGGCGYAVRGLKALNCPECGADLRKVGINRGPGAGKRGLGIALTVICGGLLLLVVAGSVFYLLLGSNQPVPATPLQPPTIQTTPTSPAVPPAAQPPDNPATLEPGGAIEDQSDVKPPADDQTP